MKDEISAKPEKKEAKRVKKNLARKKSKKKRQTEGRYKSSNSESISDPKRNREIQPKPRPVRYEANPSYSGLTDHQNISKENL